MIATILGNGPSLRGAEPQGTIFGVNRSYKLFPETDYWVTADAAMLVEFLDTYHEPRPGILISRAATRLISQVCLPRCLQANILEYEELSGGLAMRAAAEMGYETIHLAGFDGGWRRFWEFSDYYSYREPKYEAAMNRVKAMFPNVEWIHG